MLSAMTGELCTVDQAALRLKLHPKTVLRLIRQGRLKAARIGKAYRIQRADLEAFAGVEPSTAPAPRTTAIVDIPVLSADRAGHLAGVLQAALNSTARRPEPVHLETAYDPVEGRLKVVVVAPLGHVAALLRLLNGVLEQPA
jgi:excisionase family DNA binding protein